MPKLKLPAAMKLADGFIRKNKIDISSHYLCNAHLTRHIESKEGRQIDQSGWWFLWVHEDGNPGKNIDIFVSMDGKVKHTPSM